MKLNYFNYRVSHLSGHIYSFDMNSFFKAFVQIANPTWKNQFSTHGENLYLFSLGAPRTYMFLKTAKSEFIHKINRNSLGHSEIAQELQRDESLGFASYIYIGDKFMAIGSTFSAPRHTAFSQFANSIFQAVGLSDYLFHLSPLEETASRDDVLRMNYVGKMNVSLNPSNGFARSVVNLFSASANDIEEIQGVEVIIKPKRQVDMKRNVSNLFNAVGDDGIDKLVVRAKQELGDKLSDIYVEGRGVVCDYIESRDHGRIPFEIAEKVNHNAIAREKLNEVLSDESVRQEAIEHISGFSDVGNWAPFVGDV